MSLPKVRQGPDFSPLKILLSVSTLSLSDCVHGQASDGVLSMPSFCVSPIFISRAPPSWAPDSYIFLTFQLCVNSISLI